ncbi:MAG TPA: pyridoxal phosphate-dependent aminotransferase [Chthoniobacterales bacterium]|nr:pyridoxal phosphate-dependent aminotransferase [Chthoniobacterales bacterium]
MREARSEYMEWAKLHSSARFNLASSGIVSVPRTEFPQVDTQLELTAPGAYGYPPLQERLAQYTGAKEECIVAAAGTSMANHLAMAAVLQNGDEVLVEHPTYGLLLDVAHYLGASVRRFARRPEYGFAIETAEVERSLTPQTRLIVLTNLHNPSGALVPNETVAAVGELARRVGAYVLLDEVYLEMLWERERTLPVHPFIITSSLTKAYGLSGLRCGWILAEPELARRIWRLNDLFGVNAAHPAEQLSVIAFDHLERFRARTRKLLAQNRALLDAFLDSRADLECFRPPGGTVVFPRLWHGGADAFVELLRTRYETSVVPGGFFEMPQHFRIGIGGPTAEVAHGLERISAALDEFAG